jgi:hypothetical protein
MRKNKPNKVVSLYPCSAFGENEHRSWRQTTPTPLNEHCSVIANDELLKRPLNNIRFDKAFMCTGSVLTHTDCYCSHINAG